MTRRPSKRKINVLPGGWLRFLDVMGDDLSIVNDARQSFDIEHEALTESDAGLLNYLIKNRHGTPTEMVDFKFQIKAPLTVAREWFRHRNASYNEMSGRYVKMKGEFYNPDRTAIRSQTGKPGHYIFDEIKDRNIQCHVANVFEKTYNDSYLAYEQLLDFGVAKELARNVLSQGLFTKFTCKMNGRALMNFLSLRNHETAMYEIRVYAIEMEKVFADRCPLTHKAFVNNGRIAP